MAFQENPLHPIDIDDYPKLFDYVLTSNGLIYFQTLKRQYVLAKEMSLDECNKLRLLYIYYATANRNTREVLAWQNICVTLDEKGIFEKSQGAIIFPGEKYGLHSRVFINSKGLPTYEAKELGLAPRKYMDFQYDLSFFTIYICSRI